MTSSFPAYCYISCLNNHSLFVDTEHSPSQNSLLIIKIWHLSLSAYRAFDRGHKMPLTLAFLLDFFHTCWCETGWPGCDWVCPACHSWNDTSREVVMSRWHCSRYSPARPVWNLFMHLVQSVERKSTLLPQLSWGRIRTFWRGCLWEYQEDNFWHRCSQQFMRM